MKSYENNSNTSWQHVGKWYTNLVNKEGHYYQQHLVLPGVLRLLNLKKGDSLLDLGCGEGVLGRTIPKGIYYQGIDIAPFLIKTAQQSDTDSNHHYLSFDATKPLILTKKDFTSGALILSLQNMEDPKAVISNFKNHLRIGGKLIIVLNHPYFRIPRQTSWEIDQKNKIQFRRINRYLTPLKIPITQNPGKGDKSPITWSFHNPLSVYSAVFYEAGFVIEKIEEWVSDKVSFGKASKMENRARCEFPLFMAILLHLNSGK